MKTNKKIYIVEIKDGKYTYHHVYFSLNQAVKSTRDNSSVYECSAKLIGKTKRTLVR